MQEAKNILEDYKNNKKQISLRKLASTLDMGLATAWKIVRKKFGWYPYKPKTIVLSTDEHKAGRVAFCNWFLDKPKDFEQKVIWSDEEWFVLKQKPNKSQNEWYLAFLYLFIRANIIQDVSTSRTIRTRPSWN